VYYTFHNIIDPSNCAYATTVGVDFNHTRLTDIGFNFTPNLDYRPWWLKMCFVDLNCFLGQMLPPFLLGLTGQTKRFNVYVGCVGFVNILKGIIQVTTILPPANGGQECWAKNFQASQLETVRANSVGWIFHEQWGMVHGCNDMLWSGHTAQTCLGFLFIMSCLRRLGVHWGINVFIVIYFFGYVWSVLALRMHYTIDVITATIVGCFVFTNASWRSNMWMFANRVVRNEPFEKFENAEMSEMSLVEDASDEDLESEEEDESRCSIS